MTTIEGPTTFANYTSEQLQHRIEMMSHWGVLQCPDWCLRMWDEDQWEVHYGAWVPVLTGAGDDADVTVLARPVRAWWDSNRDVNADDLSRVDLAVTQTPDYPSNPEPLPAGLGFLGSGLNPDEIGELADALAGLAEKSQLADGSEWVWAFPGAEDLAEDEGGDGDD